MCILIIYLNIPLGRLIPTSVSFDKHTGGAEVFKILISEIKWAFKTSIWFENNCHYTMVNSLIHRISHRNMKFENENGSTELGVL